MTAYDRLLTALAGEGVEFIVVGGAAAIAHGSVRLTYDLDIVYDRSPVNILRLVKALAPHQPYLRGVPAGLPFLWDESTLERGLNFTLTTRIGDIDLLGEIPGGGTYSDLLPAAERVVLFGIECRCLSLKQLIVAKRAAGRPKDLEAIAELEAIDEELESGGGTGT